MAARPWPGAGNARMKTKRRKSRAHLPVTQTDPAGIWSSPCGRPRDAGLTPGTRRALCPPPCVKEHVSDRHPVVG